MVAKIIVGTDEKGFVYPKVQERTDICPICKNRIADVANLDYKVKNKKGNFLGTYDHYIIVSQKFKDFCEENHYEGLEFIQLPKSPMFYYFIVHNIYELDYKESLFLNYRDCCGSYDEIVRIPRYCKQDFYMDTDDFICRSEYRFASFSNKSYLIVVGLETADKLKKAGFKNIYFDNVYRPTNDL